MTEMWIIEQKRAFKGKEANFGVKKWGFGAKIRFLTINLTSSMLKSSVEKKPLFSAPKPQFWFNTSFAKRKKKNPILGPKTPI